MAKYDLEAVELAMRADIRKAGAIGMEMVQSGSADAEFVRTQRMFDEARIQFLLACMKAENDGIDRKVVLSSAGHAVGQIWASALSGCVGERERATVNGWARQSFASALHIDPNDRQLMSVFQASKGETVQ